MSFWKKIVQAMKGSQIAKGVSVDKIGRLAKRTGNLSKDMLRLFQTKGWKGLKGGQGAKALAQQLQKRTKVISAKLASGAKDLFSQRITPDTKQVLQAFDKTSQSLKKNFHLSQQKLQKLRRLNPLSFVSRAYRSSQQKINLAKEKVSNVSQSYDELKTKLNPKKILYNFKVGSRSYYRALIKFLAVGIFIYGIAVSIPKEIRRYYVRKQELNFERQKMGHEQVMHKRTQQTRERTGSSRDFDYPAKQGGQKNENSWKDNEPYDYAKIREREIARQRSY